MTDVDEKYRERWQDKRKKTYDWKRLVIMVLALIAILYALHRLDNVGKSDEPKVEFVDTGSEQNEPNPEGQQ